MRGAKDATPDREPSTGPTGVLILRGWSTEGDGGRRLVVRLTSRIDVESDTTETSITGSVDEVIVRVRAWLDDVLEAERGDQ